MNPRRWWLAIPAPGGWRRLELTARTIVGSGADADVRIDRPGVARAHVRLQRLQDRLEAVDLAGATQLAGRTLGSRPVVLQSGDVLRLGSLPVMVLAAADDCFAVGDLAARAPAMVAAMQALALAATTPWPLLLTGESGVGKELAARAAHQLSARRDGPWLAVNCGTLAGDTVAAELFGAQRGAYTGATANRKGAFERADGGTLFLDELGELPADAQAMLLRVLETGEIQVLGGAVRKVDVRVICATHRDLAARVAEGRFRLDLLHRIDVAAVHLPPLRERAADLLPLLQQFLDGQPLPAGTAALLAGHDWPGNVRELRNFARRLQLHCHFQPPRLDDLRALLARPQPTRPRLELLAGGRSERKAARQEHVATLLAQESQVCTAWRKSGLPRGTFFRYVKEVRLATAS